MMGLTLGLTRAHTGIYKAVPGTFPPKFSSLFIACVVKSFWNVWLFYRALAAGRIINL